MKKLTPREMYYLVCKKYPDINPAPGENLSIPEATIKIIRQCWYDKQCFTTVKQISEYTNYTPRALYKIAHDNGFDKRETINVSNVSSQKKVC